MFQGLLKQLTSIVYVQITPERLTLRYLRWQKATIEFSDVPLVATISHPKRGKHTIIGSAARTNRPPLDPEDQLVMNNGFSHPRSVIDDFDLAETALSAFIPKVMTGRKQLIAPIVFMQVMQEWEGGLTRVEQRALKELGLQCGARQVFVIHHTKPLTDEQIWNTPRDSTQF